MGLPIWRDPDEKKSARSQAKPDPTACLRSSIRRRPSVHGSGRRPNRTRLPRDPSLLPPRFERSAPTSGGFNGIRDNSSRRGQERGVPPISTLLEAAHREGATAPPPPPAPEPRTSYTDLSSMYEDGRPFRHNRTERHDTNMTALREIRLRRNLAELRAHGDALEQERDQILEEANAIGRGAEFQAIFNDRDPTAVLREDPSQPGGHTIVINPGEPLRIIRSPEPMSTRARPDSRNGAAARRSTLPTPPLDTSGPEEVAFVDTMESGEIRVTRRSIHPLSNSWRAESPIDGLGDRNRSPTPGDGWEIMRTTITPDETLPSAESSFTSAAASQSFNTSSTSTHVTEPSETSGSNSAHRGERSASVSSVDPDDLICSEEDDVSNEAFAEDVYFQEMETPEGRERIAAHQRLREEGGNRFAEASQPGRVDIGFRLIEEAFETEAGLERISQIRSMSPETIRHYQGMLGEARRIRERRRRERTSEQPPSPRPERYGEAANNTANDSRRQIHDYFRRFGADSLEPRSTSPPPYEPLNSHPDVNTFTSRDGPMPHPVSPPSNRSEREVSDALLSGDIQDVDSMRRIVERLAARDDVPEEWWTSIGLNLSRTRPHERSSVSRRRQDSPRRSTIENMWNRTRNNSRL